MSTEKTADLLTLVSACLPDHKQLKHYSLLEDIEVMGVYQDLAHQPVFREVYERYFHMERLDKMETDQLEEMKRILPKVTVCLRGIVTSLQKGAGPTLTEEDMPDFYNENKIDKLLEKLASGNGDNYTNITPDHFMDIFSKDTLKSGRELFGRFQVDEDDFGKAIQSVMNSQPYCISRDEMAHLESEYQNAVNEVSSRAGFFRQGLARRLTKKLVCCIFACMMPALVASMTGTMNSAMIEMSRTLIVIASIIFIIGG